MTQTMPTIKPADIRKSLLVQASPETAFRVFTDGFDRWWPRSHHVGPGQLVRAVIEGRPGGRWYAVNDAGGEEDWGEVLAWEPPGRLVLAWRISASFECDPRVHSEVELRFQDVGGGACRVELEHRRLDGLGEGAAQAALRMDEGWAAILELYRAAAQS